jgi:hypothetical protein
MNRGQREEEETMVRATRRTVWGVVACVVVAGCARLPGIPTPGGGVAGGERIIPTDASWRTLAANMPLITLPDQDTRERRWAAPNYGTRDWLPAIAGAGPAGESERFGGSKWVWYPEREFVFGGPNSIPPSRGVVHLRREFDTHRDIASLSDAYVDVMASGAIAVRVFVNGRAVQPEERDGDWRRDSPQDMAPRRYPIAAELRDGANVVGIQATPHMGRNADGHPVPNYVRDGVIAKIVVR